MEKQKLQVLFNQSGCDRGKIDLEGPLICCFTPDYILTFVNDAFCRYFGFERSELIRRNFLSLITPEGRKRLENALKVLTPQTPTQMIEYPVIVGQAYHTQQWTNQAIFNRQGDLIEFLAVGRDITHSVAAAQLAVAAQTALRETEQRLPQMAQNIPEIFWMVSADWNELIYVSPTYKAIWGTTCEGLNQRPRLWLKAIHPSDRVRVREALTRPLQNHLVEIECRIIRPDGEIRWLWLRAFPVRNTAGEISRISGIAVDITAQQPSPIPEAETLSFNLPNPIAPESDRQIAPADPLDPQLNELKLRFVSMVCHEFGNPLSQILMSVELLENFGKQATAEQKQHYLSRIKYAAHQMSQLLNDVLMFGSAESGYLDFNPESLDLISFCREVVEEVQLTAGSSHQISLFITDAQTGEIFRQKSAKVSKYTYKKSEKIIYQLDAKLLRHILINLLSNAVKYSPKGGLIKFEILIQSSDEMPPKNFHNVSPLKSKKEFFSKKPAFEVSQNFLFSYPNHTKDRQINDVPQQIIFKIQDSGIGIPPENIPQLFDTFYRAKNVGKIRGTGLGLAIVKKAVELHGGQISVESELGVGTTFTVMLPLNN